MAKFCSWCGEPLEPGARYCPECGARVLESVKVDGSADAVDPMRGFDIVGGEAVPADKTVKLDREQDPSGTDTLVLPTDNTQKRFTLEGAPKKSKVALVVCIAVIVVLLAVVGVLLWMQNQSSQTDDQSFVPVTHQEAQDEGDSDGDAPAVSDATVEEPSVQEPPSEEVSDEEAFEALDTAYGRLNAYNERIAGCVEDFNGWFLARSMDERTAAKKTADDLLAELNDELAALEDLRIPADSPYADDAAAVIELYGCQVGRVQSLADAWAVDVTFDVPSEHKDEILAELSKSNEGGTNKYLTRYDELYPTAKPQKE